MPSTAALDTKTQTIVVSQAPEPEAQEDIEGTPLRADGYQPLATDVSIYLTGHMHTNISSP